METLLGARCQLCARLSRLSRLRQASALLRWLLQLHGSRLGIAGSGVLTADSVHIVSGACGEGLCTGHVLPCSGKAQQLDVRKINSCCRLAPQAAPQVALSPAEASSVSTLQCQKAGPTSGTLSLTYVGEGLECSGSASPAWGRSSDYKKSKPDWHKRPEARKTHELSSSPWLPQHGRILHLAEV